MTDELPNGTFLRDIRKASGLDMDEAIERANLIATELGVSDRIRFSERSMRRFENIDINNVYGKTPPTYAELNILMRTYNGAPGYLILGIEPAGYPVDQFDRHKSSFFTNDMIGLMSDIASWSLSRQHTFFQFYKEFVKLNHGGN